MDDECVRMLEEARGCLLGCRGEKSDRAMGLISAVLIRDATVKPAADASKTGFDKYFDETMKSPTARESYREARAEIADAELVRVANMAYSQAAFVANRQYGHDNAMQAAVSAVRAAVLEPLQPVLEAADAARRSGYGEIEVLNLNEAVGALHASGRWPL